MLLDLVWPSDIEGNIVFILLEHKHLAAALGGKKTLVICGLFEEARDIIWTHPVTTTGRFDEQLALTLFASADYTALVYHVGACPRPVVSI
jgi:hypothetical protein